MDAGLTDSFEVNWEQAEGAGGGDQENSLLSDLLVSGGEIEGMFQQKRKQEKDKKANKKSGSNGLKDPVIVLKDRLSIYNDKKDKKYWLTLNEEDLTYTGLIAFQYNNSYQILFEDVKVKNTDNASSLIPVLLSHFLPQSELVATQAETSSSYIVLTQGGIERELDRAERPLEVALDCSIKGLLSPTFTLKTSISLLLQLPNTPQHLRKKLSSSSLATSSHSSLGHVSSEGSESPRVTEAKMIPMSDETLYAHSNNTSGTSTSYSSMTHPPRGGGGGGGGGMSKSLFKSRTQANNSKHKALELTSAKISDSSLNSPVGTPTGLVPDKRPKSKVGNFVEGVARSFKSKRKPRPTSIYPESAGQVVGLRGTNSSAVLPTGASPKQLGERRFTMPTVLHIHYSNAKGAQLYKSVLVSEKSSTQEVIKQALDRYGMKSADPTEFLLMEVTGRWETMASSSLETGLEQGLGALVTPLSPGNPLDGKTISMPAFEEFVICHTRALTENERPYNIQFYHQPPPGYTRRFELKSKYDEDEFGTKEETGGDKQLLSKELPGSVPTTPLFGSTSHHKTKTNNRLGSEETLSYSTTSILKDQDNEREDETIFSASLPSLSFLDCTSPDYVLESQTAQTDSQSLRPSLINLRLNYNDDELLVYSLTHDKLALTTSEHVITTLQDHHQIKLHVTRGGSGPILCCLEYNTREHNYTIEPYNATISVSGVRVSDRATLQHGDLLQIGDTHLFMYQNFSQPQVGGNNGWPFSWYPSPVKTTGASTISTSNIGDVRDSETSHINPILPQIITTSVHETMIPEPQSAVPDSYVTVGEQRYEERYDFSNRKPLPTLREIEHSDEEDLHNEPDGRPSYHRTRSYSEGQVKTVSSPSGSPNRRNNKPSSSSFFVRHQKGTASSKNRPSSCYSLLFHHLSSNEDSILDLIINEFQPKSVPGFPLAPTYTLALCLEQCLREEDGKKKASGLMRKAVLSLQQVVCDITNESLWQETNEEDLLNANPLAAIQPLLHSVLFWFSNCLEVYNYFLTQETLKDILFGDEEEEESPLTLLETMIHKLFEQIFYPVSKILYSILPMMLDEVLHHSGHSGSPLLSVDQSISCLKEVLDMMLELHVHTEMIAHFFASVFFFLNAALFNTFIDQGHEMGLFKYSRGTKLRMSLDKLEGWAGIVGFRDIVFQFLGTFSSAIDLIAISPHELIKFSWDTLRQEFPCLHPVQLNHILTHYILPKGLDSNNSPWTPSKEDLRQIENKDMLHESFESHPDFYLPITGYSLDLNCQLQEDHLLQDFAMSLQEKLVERKRTGSLDSPKARHSQSPIVKRKTSKPSLDVSDIVRDSPDFSKSPHRQKIAKVKRTRRRSGNREVTLSDSPGGLRGRVKSIVAANMMILPEKLTIIAQAADQGQREEEREDDYDDYDFEKWVKENFPEGSNLISLQRSHRGFGFTLKEKKGRKGLYIEIDDTHTLNENTADIRTGDQVLAIDDLVVAETDYAMIMKYFKEAEEEISVVLAPPNQQWNTL